MCEVSHRMDSGSTTHQDNPPPPVETKTEPDQNNEIPNAEKTEKSAIPAKTVSVSLRHDQVEQIVDIESCREAFKMYDKDDSGTIPKAVSAFYLGNFSDSCGKVFVRRK